MLKSSSLVSLFAALLLGLASHRAKADAPFQFGVFAPELQLVAAGDSVKGLRINFVYGENVNMSGLDLGIVNSSTGDFSGIGWAPGANLVGGSARGIQWSWLYSHTAGEFTGWQSGILNRISGPGSAGLQTGWVNLVESDFTGLQFGLVNRAAAVRGLQLGFVNLADRLDGLQIGLINYAANSAINPIMPLVNWNF
ncbi:MAG: hypothetical protein RL376_693 [Verrucomicrobiota bacterium]|jgi:hypothetical protein